MKGLIKFFLVICTVGILLLSIQNVLFPFVYKIKEPRFAMPIEVQRKVETIEDLPVRHDAYGSGNFGAKRRNGRRHKGLDLKAEMHSPVYASKSGWTKTYYFPEGYGNLIIINHPGKWQTRYGHLSRIAIKNFQWVRQGDIIGSVGKTGNANSKEIIPHLHFEIRYRNKVFNPAKELIKKPTRLP